MNSSTKTGDGFGNYISQAEAARIIGTSSQTVANLIRRGQFTTKRAAGRTFVLRSEVESFVVRPKGRPAKKELTKKLIGTTREETVEKYISQAEAARIRGVSQQAIANLIKRNRLFAVNVAGSTLVLRSEVEAFVTQPKRGRPPEKKIKKESLKSVEPKKK